ncbi:MAG: hypothetical protein J5631_07620, partial [Spirochaetaceae bacterium]|nr:hypothetical protein [Spirochaetaceae bacterium]
SMLRVKDQPQDGMLYSLDAVLELTDKRFVRPNVLVLNKLMQSLDKGDANRKEQVTVQPGNGNQIEIKNLVVDLTNLVNKFDPKQNK